MDIKCLGQTKVIAFRSLPFCNTGSDPCKALSTFNNKEKKFHQINQSYAPKINTITLNCSKIIKAVEMNSHHCNRNRPFYSCSQVTWPKNGGVAAGDPALIQTFVLF